MRSKSRQILPIILIIVLSIVLGYLANMLWTLVEKQAYPATYDEIITAASIEFSVPKAVIYATIKVESGFRADARSSAGAVGLMQMLPSTLEWLASSEHLDENVSPDDLTTPKVSIRYGTYYLAYLYRKFDCNWNTAFAAYNGGEGNVAEWLSDPEYSDGNGSLTDIPFPETKKYVKKINSAIDTYERLYPENKYTRS